MVECSDLNPLCTASATAVRDLDAIGMSKVQRERPISENFSFCVAHASARSHGHTDKWTHAGKYTHGHTCTRASKRTGTQARG